MEVRECSGLVENFADHFLAVSDFNTLPDLWIEEPEATLQDMLEAKSATMNVCEYTIKVPAKKNVAIKYTYLDEVQSPMSST